jgi:hypothetical protein
MSTLDRRLSAWVACAGLIVGMTGACATAKDTTVRPSDGDTGGKETGGKASGGGSDGGSPGGSTSSGGTSSTSGGTARATGGVNPSGGRQNSGGTVAMGGTMAVGGTSIGGFVATGGILGLTGGLSAALGGSTAAVGGTSMLMTGGATGTGGSTGTGPYTVLGGGYVTSGSWMGYAWVSATPTGSSSITPANFTTLLAGAQLCVTGSVTATTDSSGTAMIGINIAQAPSTTVTGTWTPATSTGLTYSITNPGLSPIRIQIQGPNGATDANQRWCYTTTALSGTIPWASFNTQCWQGGLGVAYSPTSPIAAVMVMVPGTTTAVVPFSFCIVSIGPA